MEHKRFIIRRDCFALAINRLSNCDVQFRVVQYGSRWIGVEIPLPIPELAVPFDWWVF